MSVLTVRLSDEKHQRLKVLARKRGTTLNRLIDEMTTIMLAEFDAETRFDACATRGAGREERGLELLRKTAKGGPGPMHVTNGTMYGYHHVSNAGENLHFIVRQEAISSLHGYGGQSRSGKTSPTQSPGKSPTQSPTQSIKYFGYWRTARYRHRPYRNRWGGNIVRHFAPITCTLLWKRVLSRGPFLINRPAACKNTGGPRRAGGCCSKCKGIHRHECEARRMKNGARWTLVPRPGKTIVRSSAAEQ